MVRFWIPAFILKKYLLLNSPLDSPVGCSCFGHKTKTMCWKTQNFPEGNCGVGWDFWNSNFGKATNSANVNLKNMDPWWFREISEWTFNVSNHLSFTSCRPHSKRESPSWKPPSRTFICVTWWNILTRGSADSETPQREEGLGQEGSEVSARKWEQDKGVEREKAAMPERVCQQISWAVSENLYWTQAYNKVRQWGRWWRHSLFPSMMAVH